MKRRTPILLALRSRTPTLLIAALLAALAVSGTVLAAGGAAIAWQVISGGGAPASGGNVSINDTLGQPVAGPSSGGNINLQAGYWAPMGVDDDLQCGLVQGDDYTFTPAYPVTITLVALGDIDCLRVRRFEQNHPAHTGTSTGSGTGWGRYWTITATNSLGATAAGFTLTLNLPSGGAAEPLLCKYPGGMGGSGWDCAVTNFNGSRAWRSGITSLSDWTVGNKVSATAVERVGFAAASRAAPGAWLLVLAGGIIFCVLLLRQRRS